MAVYRFGRRLKTVPPPAPIAPILWALYSIAHTILGVVTDPAAIHLAYNDPQGITAAFNRNVLRNVNSFVRSNFDAEKFAHYAPYIVEKQRIEMWLVAREAMDVDLGRLGSTLRLARGEGIRTEISRRFTREQVLRMIDSAGFTPERWIESPDARFGLALGVARTSLRGI